MQFYGYAATGEEVKSPKPMMTIIQFSRTGENLEFRLREIDHRVTCSRGFVARLPAGALDFTFPFWRLYGKTSFTGTANMF
jgi:tRNA U55 pseudouridine synthase TruB